MKPYRIKAYVLRHLYEIGATLDRKVDIVFWPTIDLLTFGLLSVYINKLNGAAGIVGAILGGLILWTLVYNIQRDISVSLLEEAWSRNLYNLISSPLRPGEIIMAILFLSFIKALITIAFITFLAWGLFGFNLFGLGAAVVFYVFNLFLFGWAFGFMTAALIFRFGIEIQTFAWSLIAVIYPISGVFYPLSTLPDFLAKIAQLLPISHVFEGLRGIILNQTLPAGSDFVLIFVLNIVYLTFGIVLFRLGFKNAKNRGWFIHPT